MATLARVAPAGRLDLRWPDPDQAWPVLVPLGGDGAALFPSHRPPVQPPVQPPGEHAAGPRPSDLLDEVPGGPLGLAIEAATADPAALADAELLDAIVVFERMTAWAAAEQARLLAEFARRRPAHDTDAPPTADSRQTSRYAADEIGLALRLSRGTASIRLEQARRLDEDLPDTLHAWQAGRLDHTKVRAVLDATETLPPATAAAVQDRVLPRAAGQTAGQLRAALARAVLTVDREGAGRRHEQARRDRRVAVNPDRDGMASLAALLPAPDALSAFEWLTRLARGMGSHDPRPMDARRADLLVALLTGRLTVAAADPSTSATATDATDTGRPAEAHVAADGEPVTGGAQRVPLPQPLNPGKPLIQVVVPLDTLNGTADHPGDLVGYGPVPADLARRIVADGLWKRLVTDPLSGALLDHGRTTYRPPAALAEFVRARDVHCRHPICRRRAIDSELDHTVAYSENGETAAHNLYGSCPHHHHLKHDAPGWTVTQHPDATITWTTPTGHSYTSAPHDYRPDHDPSEGPGLSRYILDQAGTRSGPAPPPPRTVTTWPPSSDSSAEDSDPPPF